MAQSQNIDDIFSTAWNTFAKIPKRTEHSKSWWNNECSIQAQKLREMRERLHRSKLAQRHKRQVIKNLHESIRAITLEEVKFLLRQQVKREQRHLAHLISSDNILNSYVRIQGRRLKGAAARAHREFFDQILYKTHSFRIWDMVEWTKPRRQPTDKGLTDNQKRSADTMQKVGELFQEQFTPQDPPLVDVSFVEEMEQQPERSFPPYGKLECRESLAEVSNFSAPGPDNVDWFWIKRIVRTGKNPDDPRDDAPVFDTETPILLLFDACVKFACYPPFFKQSVTTCIPKPKKPNYTKAKAFRPIVLLNCLGKLKEKMLACRMQFDGQKYGLMHPSQFGGAIQHSTQDAGTQLVHNIKQMWKQGINSTAILLDVSQFYPSINQDILARILKKQGFHKSLCDFMTDYLSNRKTQFLFNNKLTPTFDFSTGVGQGSSLSPILSGLYIAPAIHKIAPVNNTINLAVNGNNTIMHTLWTKEQIKSNGHATVQFYVDDGLIHVGAKISKESADPQYEQLLINNILIKDLYHKLLHQLHRIGLNAETDKLELMHFIKRRNKGGDKWTESEPLGPSIHLLNNGNKITITPKKVMRYLEFYLDPKLNFKEHIRYYATKAASTINTL